jgi:hypothetical protein
VNEQAHDLIDKQKYDEAIELLTPRQQQNPDNIEYALILATAYAGKAGVHVEEIWGFTLGYETPYFKINNFDNEESLKKYQILTQQVSKQNDQKWLMDFLKVVVAYEAFLQRWQKIPEINDPLALQNLQQAVLILDGAQDKKTSLYNFILRIILFKNKLQDGLNHWQEWQESFLIASSSATSLNDKVVLSQLCIYARWFVDLTVDLEKMINALKISYPSKVPQLNDTLKSLSQFQQGHLCESIP